jgi:tetratricopeptide (TPR) repeat protein
MHMRSRTWIFTAAAMALSLAGAGHAQQPASPPKTPPQQPAATTGQKVIKDADEYNAYMKALGTADPVQKAAAMEAFAARYPNSIVHVDALEQAMAAYQQSGNTVKVEDAANRILKLAPRNVRALAIMTVLERSRATQGQAEAMARMREHAELGLKMLPGWKKPVGTDDATYKKMRDQMTSVFNGAAGFAALQAKDYAKAASYYRVVVKLDPGNLQDTYQLAVAELQSDPIDPNGFWHIGRAIALAKTNAAALKNITDYGKAKYRKFHGGDDGWDAIVARAATQAAPPANFAASITAAPTLAELAVQAVRDNDPADLSFSDYEIVLGQRDASPANKDAADKVWQVIRAKQRDGAARLKIAVKVISTTRDTMLGAITDENQAANTADLQVTMKQPMATPPAAGASIAIIGVISDYVPSPFMFIMKDGELAAP